MSQIIDTQRALLHQEQLLALVKRLDADTHRSEALAAVPGMVKDVIQADSVSLASSVDSDLVFASEADGLAAKAFDQNKPALLSALAQSDLLDTTPAEEWLPLAALGIKRLVALPIRTKFGQNSLLIAVWRMAYELDDADRVFLKLAAHQVANALNSAQIADYLAAILANVTDPVLVIDQMGVIALANQAANQALNLPADAIGRRAEEILQGEPIIGLLHTKKPDANKSVEWQSQAGPTYTARIAEYEHPVSGQRGRVLILRDITRFKQLHANHTDFVDTVLHDLRSPLTYMQGYANMLPMVGELTPKQKDFADKITTGITQMSDLVEKSLDAGRLDPETGYYELSRELCDLAKVTSEVVGTHLQSAEKRGLTLTAEIDPELPLLSLDVMLLRRALNNLVDNAIKYTPAGGAVTVTAFSDDSAVLLSVRDTGLGISPDNQRHLFERFRRVHRTEHQRVKGSGLGLFVVKNVAQRHGGDAWVESVEQVGSTFSIRIPIAGANLPGIAGKSAAENDNGK